MAKLILTADIHGHYASWQRIRELIEPEDTLAIAGDLFDTKYQTIAGDDYVPERIREEYLSLTIPKYYVYGNCDQSTFFPEHEKIVEFVFNGKRIQLRHGHFKKKLPSSLDILVEGHSHIAKLEKNASIVTINPGSIPLSRNGLPSYAIITDQTAQLIQAETHRIIKSLNL